MDYSFACGDVVDGCPAILRADTHDEMMAKVEEHAARDHDLVVLPGEVAARVLAAVRRTT